MDYQHFFLRRMLSKQVTFWKWSSFVFIQSVYHRTWLRGEYYSLTGVWMYRTCGWKACIVVLLYVCRWSISCVKIEQRDYRSTASWRGVAEPTAQNSFSSSSISSFSYVLPYRNNSGKATENGKERERGGLTPLWMFEPHLLSPWLLERFYKIDETWR